MSRVTLFRGRFRLVVALLATWCAIAAGTVMYAGSASAATTPSRAMWVWSKASPTDVVSFAQSHGVSQLFVAVPWNVAEFLPQRPNQDAARRAGAIGTPSARTQGAPIVDYRRD